MGPTHSMPVLPAVTPALTDPPGYFWLRVAVLDHLGTGGPWHGACGGARIDER